MAATFFLASCSKDNDETGGGNGGGGETGGVTDVTPVTSDLTVNLTTDKACYRPGETVSFTADVLPAGAKVRYRTLNQVISEQAAAGSSLIIHGGLVMNVKTHECLLDEKPLPLTPTEFSILKILCERKGEAVSSEDLFHSVWKDEYYSKSNNTITVHIRHLREKMNDSVEHPKYIKTIWGVGYKIENG